jgi:hypothetical protein
MNLLEKINIPLALSKRYQNVDIGSPNAFVKISQQNKSSPRESPPESVGSFEKFITVINPNSKSPSDFAKLGISEKQLERDKFKKDQKLFQELNQKLIEIQSMHKELEPIFQRLIYEKTLKYIIELFFKKKSKKLTYKKKSTVPKSFAMHNAKKEDYLYILQIEKTKDKFKRLKNILEDKVKQYNYLYDKLETKYHKYYELQTTDVLTKMPTHNELKHDLQTRSGIKLNNITQLELDNLLKEYMTIYKINLKKQKKKYTSKRSNQREIERRSRNNRNSRDTRNTRNTRNRSRRVAPSLSSNNSSNNSSLGSSRFSINNQIQRSPIENNEIERPPIEINQSIGEMDPAVQSAWND